MQGPNKRRQEEVLRVAEQAAEWLIRLEDGERAHYPQLAEWLLESPLHTQMFLRAAAIDRQAMALHPQIRAALEAGLQAASGGTVVPLQMSGSASTNVGKPIAPSLHSAARGSPPRFVRDGGVRGNRFWSARALGAAAAVAAVAVSALWFVRFTGPQTYATAVGEQRAFDLPDGSVVYLNTRSRLEVSFDRDARDLRLVEGEALFSVRRDPSRPFRVHVEDSTVQAIGTQFNVYRRNARTTVAVLEGLVEISSPAEKPSRVPAGETATLTSTGPVKVQQTSDGAKAIAWRQRQLVFEWAPLTEIAEEFNRYNRAPQLRIDGEAVGKRRYTAVFNADDPELLIQFLSQDPGLEFSPGEETVVIRQR